MHTNGVCEGISMSESLKVKKLSLESALCYVDQYGSTHNVTNFQIIPVAVWRITELSNTSSTNTRETKSHKFNITAVLPTYTKHTNYPMDSDGLRRLLTRYHSIISLPSDYLGSTNAIEHPISLLLDASPVYIPVYRHSHTQRAVVDNLVNDMLANDILEHPTSPWNFSLFLVSTNDGSFRPVADYMRLNKLGRQKRYPLPVLQGIIMSISPKHSVVATLDLVSGYWEVPLMDDSK